jgi:hypothetical protein
MAGDKADSAMSPSVYALRPELGLKLRDMQAREVGTKSPRA